MAGRRRGGWGGGGGVLVWPGGTGRQPRHNLAVVGQPAAVPYKETIRRGTQQHSRFKRQSGGHGQFADVTIEGKALPPGSGFTFTDSVVAGAIPRNYSPAVGEGCTPPLHPTPL